MISIFFFAQINVSQLGAETLREAMTIASLLESAAMTINILDQRYNFSDSQLSLEGTYSDQGGTLTITGMTQGAPFQMAFSGTTMLDFPNLLDISVSTSSSGSWFGAPISTSGSSVYLYDVSFGDYRSMRYSDQGLFGTPAAPGQPSVSWKTRGSEVMAGLLNSETTAGWPGAFEGVIAAWMTSNLNTIFDLPDAPIYWPDPPPWGPYDPSAPNNWYNRDPYWNICNFGRINGQGTFGGGILSGTMTVPEFDSTTGGGALSLVAGVLAMIEQRRRRGAATTAIAA
jgi:hypothetical protein